jgi:hypothetical protein
MMVQAKARRLTDVLNLQLSQITAASSIALSFVEQISDEATRRTLGKALAEIEKAGHAAMTTMGDIKRTAETI